MDPLGRVAYECRGRPRVCASSSSSATTCPPIRTRSRCRTSPVRAGSTSPLPVCRRRRVPLTRDPRARPSPPRRRRRVYGHLRRRQPPAPPPRRAQRRRADPGRARRAGRRHRAHARRRFARRRTPADGTGSDPRPGARHSRYLQRVPTQPLSSFTRTAIPRRRRAADRPVFVLSDHNDFAPPSATCSRTVRSAAYASVPSYSMPTTPSLSSTTGSTPMATSPTDDRRTTTAPATDDRFAVPLRASPSTRDALCPLGRPRRRGRAPVRLL